MQQGGRSCAERREKPREQGTGRRRRRRSNEAEERRRALQRPSQADEMVARREGAARNRQRRQRDDDERAVSMASLWQRRETQVATATARRRAELDSLCQKRRTPKGGRRLAHHTPPLKIPVWWRRAVLPSLLWVF